MLTQQEYLLAWLVYLLGSVACLAVVWVMTKNIPWSEVRGVLRIVAGVFMLVPWYISEDSAYLAPAWIASFLEGIFDGPDAFWRAGTPLVVSLVVVLCVSSGVHAYLWWRSKKAENYAS